MNSRDILLKLLSIPSPTFAEKKKADFIFKWLNEHFKNLNINRYGNNVIANSEQNDSLETIGFIGHIDHVPEFFKPYEKDGCIYGAGASDMQGGIASFLTFLVNNPNIFNQYNICIIIYDKEEGTALHENGLNECIQVAKSKIKNIDIAIVAEPTNNTIQLGCVGSIHATLNVKGKGAHSARPWHGENALYKALPIIKKSAELKPLKQKIFGVEFYDVLQITESESDKGRTTIPENWTCNINYRFSPNHTLNESIQYIETFVESSGIKDYELKILSAVDAGKVIEHAILKNIKNIPIQAKQAWTDVAQLTAIGVCAFNFGPGLQEQAHQKNEHIKLSDMKEYETLLKKVLGA